MLFLLIVFRGEIKEREKESKGENREEIDEKVERGENVFNYLQFFFVIVFVCCFSQIVDFFT